MNNYAELMGTNPPRLVVLFRYGLDGSEQFEWGVVGAIPIVTLIGYISRVQMDLMGGGWIPECSESALAITWNQKNHSLQHFVHPSIPCYPLVGMLETIKAMLVDSRLAQHAAAQQIRLLGLDGQPVKV